MYGDIPERFETFRVLHLSPFRNMVDGQFFFPEMRHLIIDHSPGTRILLFMGPGPKPFQSGPDQLF